MTANDVLTVGNGVTLANTDQDINGTKTFLKSVIRSTSDNSGGFGYLDTNLPSARTSYASTTMDTAPLYVRNSNDNTFAMVEFKEVANTSRELNMAVYGPTAGWKYLKLKNQGSNTWVESPIIKVTDNSAMVLKNTSITKGTVPSASSYRSFLYQDTTESNIGHITFTSRVSSTDTNNNVLELCMRDYNQTNAGQLKIYSGNPSYATVSYRTSNLTNWDILTPGNGLTIATDQDISGVKTFYRAGFTDIVIQEILCLVHC